MAIGPAQSNRFPPSPPRGLTFFLGGLRVGAPQGAVLAFDLFIQSIHSTTNPLIFTECLPCSGHCSGSAQKEGNNECQSRHEGSTD